ncbi:hypothetical protein JCM8547_003023 [Rhodosporidiobolus lusitaniae]
MASEDPLLLLRQALTSGHEIHLLNSAGKQVFDLSTATDLAFTSSSSSAKRQFPKSHPTRFLHSGENVDDPNAKNYDLSMLLFAYLHRDDTVGEYMKKATQSGVPPVQVMDRKVVNDYLGGRSGVEGPEGRVRPLEGAAGGAKRAAEDEPAAAAAPAGGAAGAPPAAKKQRFRPNAEDQENVRKLLQIVEGPAYGHVVGPGEEKKERTGAVYHNRETVLRGERVNNFDSVRALIGPRLKTLREAQSSSSSAPTASSSSAPPGGPGGKPQKKKQLNPIIIISPSSTALITMHNVKQFLEEATFIPSDLARQQVAASGGSGRAEDVLVVNHARVTTSAATAETRKARYFVVDGVEALSKFGGAGKLDEAWERVVCVMTTGQEWQFKPYKWKEPKELFHHVRGIYPQWTSDPVNDKVKSWNVSELRIDPHKRHIDKSTVAEFWRNLEAWIGKNKPWLSY